MSWKIYENQVNLDDDLLLNTGTEIPTMTIVARAIFLENDKDYP